jgi:hypothetical protein
MAINVSRSRQHVLHSHDPNIIITENFVRKNTNMIRFVERPHYRKNESSFHILDLTSVHPGCSLFFLWNLKSIDNDEFTACSEEGMGTINSDSSAEAPA